MNCIAHTLLLLLLTVTHLFAQNKAPLQLASSISTLHVTPGEQFIIADRAGEVAMADSLNGDWHLSRKDNQLLDHAIFFNHDTGFVAGFIHYNGNENIIYHTIDGGKTWQNVDFSTSGWADGACNLADGQAWMTIAGKGIVYSKDYGLTWTLFPVYDVKQRYQTVFFNQNQEGIIGSIYNSIAYTNDNGQHWKKIPSPLDQQAYIKTDKNNQPRIDKVSIYKNILLASQEGMLFYTLKDSIQWKFLADYQDFSTDATNTALFLINDKRELIRSDEKFASLQTASLTGYCYNLTTRNGKAFFLSGKNIVSFEADGQLHKYALQTSEVLHATPQYIYSPTMEFVYGINGNMIYTNDNDVWKYAFTLPHPAGELQNISATKNMINYQTNDSLLHYYDITTHKETVTTMKKMLNAFQQSPVTSVTFSQGSTGCFHSYSDALVYKPEGNLFVLSDNKSWGSKHTTNLKPDIEEIDEQRITQFVKEICLHYNRQPVIQEMNFSNQDYKQCKADIRAYQEAKPGKSSPFYFAKNNVDFDRLVSTVDTIKSIDSISLNAALQYVNAAIYSTTSNMIAVTFTNEAGATLKVLCSNSGEKGFYTCWNIQLNYNNIVSTSPVIPAFFQQCCPSSIADMNRVAVMHELVRRSYK